MTPTLSLGHPLGPETDVVARFSFQVIEDRETGISRGFGFVTFGDKRSMDDAIAGKSIAVHTQSDSIQYRNTVYLIGLHVQSHHEAEVYMLM